MPLACQNKYFIFTFFVVVALNKFKNSDYNLKEADAVYLE